jgi:hypothetical protein
MDHRSRSDHHHSDDELVSIVLDGVATPEDRAAVTADPRLRRRLESFARVRHLLGHDVPSPVVAPVPERGRHRRALLIAAAATLVLVVAGFGWALADGGRNAADLSASAPSPASEPAPEFPAPVPAADGTTPQRGEVGAVEGAPDGGPLPRIGEFDSLDGLRAAAVDRASDPAAPDNGPCHPALVTREATPVGTASLRGLEVLVGVRADGSVLVLEVPGCRPVG